MGHDRVTHSYPLPALPKLLHSWKNAGEFYFYRKFLVEVNRDSPKNTLQSNRISLFHKVRVFLGKFSSLAGFASLFVQCLFVPKGKIVLFNHSGRYRSGVNGIRPLYLTTTNFDLAKMVIFENTQDTFTYPPGTIKFHTKGIGAITSIASKLLGYGCRKIYGTGDSAIIYFIVQMHVWKILLGLIKPLRVHVLVWYGKEPLIAACKQLGIEVWDLQHGIVYEEHPIYNIQDSAGIQNSDFLLPDRCLVYGEYWKQHLLRSGWKEREVSVVGYFIDIEPSFPIVSDVPYILYTSQPHRSLAIIQHILSIETEVRHRGWKILIAIHPAENDNVYSEVVSDNIQVSSGFDSYDLLRNCVAHISVSSTLLWEAMVFGKPSFVLEYGQEMVGLLGDLLDFGYGRALAEGEFPEPFTLPATPERDFFFCSTINKVLLNGLAEH